MRRDMTRTLNSNRKGGRHDTRRMRPFLEYLHDWIGESGYTRTRGCCCARRCWWPELIVEQSERGRLSGRPFVRWPR